ncbi:MAG: hypothetical protein LC640_03260 [Frankia sp.]|nr:hypothetical protein [Frankia sp.]
MLSARRSSKDASATRAELAARHGETFDVAGRPEAAFPSPAQLLGVAVVDGVSADRLDRLHGVADAALAGRLDVERLTAFEPAEAMVELQAIPGIGPFYSELIVARATGLTDVLPMQEPRVRELAGQLYGLRAVPTEGEYRRLAEPWRPFRTWAAVLIRAVGPRLLPP